MTNDPIATRLTLLKQEFAKGQLQLQEMERQETALREALLRISGAIEVLEEVAGQHQNQLMAARQAPATDSAPMDPFSTLGRITS